MGMIDRYKKSGGFIQLLNLIETCGPAKQEKLLSLVFQEAPNWANAIKKKMLSIDRIMTWPEQSLAEVFAQIQDLTLATALFGFDESSKEKIFKYFSHSQIRRIEGLMAEKQPSQGEISASYMKIIEEVRQQIKDGTLRVEDFDAELMIEDDIEELLSKGASFGADYVPEILHSSESSGNETAAPVREVSSGSVGATGGSDPGEVLALKKKVLSLTQEKSQLEEEVRLLRGKLEQIRKIA